MISKDSLKGYILEEIIAYLIRNTGYKLLVDPIQDARELERRGNGLVVKGRGAVHQADVLGQLTWIPAFTYPIRLFIEAKFREKKTGIPDVRNAIGILNDINQNYSPVREGQILTQRFSYRYALFSTSGFTKTASDMAIAHQISLIDLSGPNFEDLRVLIDKVAKVIVSDLKELGANKQGLLGDGLDNNQKISMKGIIHLFRAHMRGVLGTWPLQGKRPLNSLEYHHLRSKVPSLDLLSREILATLNRYEELFVGMANGPFLLILKCDDPEGFVNYSSQNPVHRVTITWFQQDNQESQWTIRPVNNKYEYSLTFSLPQALRDWIFGNEASTSRSARSIKERYLSSITIYRFKEGQDQLIRLIYDANATYEYIRNN